jgi:transcriptional regulator with XRE-family HTH domain/Zn-dependent peptidase ImmA (M78 family)
MGKHKTPAEREIALRVGARIRQLREIQHISQVRLATEIGIRAGPLGWIEKGKHLPSGRVLYRLAKQLNVRLDDLFQESDVWQAAAQSMSDTAPVLLPPLDIEAAAEPVKASHIVCQSVADKLIELEDLCGVAKTPTVPLRVPFLPTEAGAEYVASRVRQSLGIGDAIVSDYLELLEGAGLRVVFLDMPDGCDTFSGYDRQNRNAFIFVNSRLKKQPEHQVYRLSFELGRLYWYTRKLHVAVAEEAQPGGDEAVLDEAQFARRFAAHFLMPTRALQATVWRLGMTPKAWSFETLLRLKKRYGVSAQNIALRLQGLGLSWSDKQKRSPRYYLFKDEVEAFAEANGPLSEPGGNRFPLTMNGRLCDLLLRAEQSAGKDQKALNAIKRVLRQSGVKLDA